MKNIALIAILAFSLVACDKNCSTTENATVNVYNTLGTTFSVALCDNATGEKQIIQVSENPLQPNKAEAMVSYLNIQSGTKAASSCDKGSAVGMADITLAQESAGYIKLCKSKGGLEFHIVRSFSMCPSNTTEQTLTSNCN